MPQISAAQTTEASAGQTRLSHAPGDAAAAPARRPDGVTADAETLPAPRPGIAVADWDVMFDAVRARLLQAVGERLDKPPGSAPHPAELSASGVEAVVLDCVSALDQLHHALQQERRQRPTP